jgi:hypothetical protein
MIPSLQGTKYCSFIVLSLAITVLLSHWQGATAFSAHPLVHQRHLVLARPFGTQTPPRTRSRPRTTASTSSNTQLAVFNELADAYNFALAHYTLPTEATTAAVLACLGDCIAQTVDIRDPEKKQESFNAARTRNFFIKGLGSGVIWSIYYRDTDVLCGDWATQLLSTTAVVEANSEFLVATVKTVLAVLLEEVIAMPLVMSLWDIPVPAILSGSALSTIPGQVKSKLPELIVENAKVWTLVNILIYNIPVQYRLLVMSVANVFWQSVVSKITSQEIVLENAGAETLGIYNMGASFENNTSASVVGGEDVLCQSIGGVAVGADVESMAHMESSAFVVDDYAGSVEQGLLGNTMEAMELAAPGPRETTRGVGGEVPAWVFQQTTAGNGTSMLSTYRERS